VIARTSRDIAGTGACLRAAAVVSSRGGQHRALRAHATAHRALATHLSWRADPAARWRPDGFAGAAPPGGVTIARVTAALRARRL
jgi:hypothetical protein